MNSIEFPEMNYKHFREKNVKFHIFLLLSIMGGISLITIYDRKFRHNRPEEGLPKMITYISPINMVAEDNHLYFAYKSPLGIGDTLENDDKVFYLLCSLPERFDMIVATIENSDSFPDFEVVVRKLMEQDAKQRERCEEIKSATKALASKINNEKRTCHHCHKPGHIAKNCWILHPDLKKGKPYKQMSANHSAKVSYNEETKKCE